MLIISEYKLSKELIEAYHSKGYRIAYGYQEPRIFKGESVGILLDNLYRSTIELIEQLLYSKHKVTLKYEGKTYLLESLDEWRRTYQSDKDQLKTESVYHPIYQDYLDKKKEYRDKAKIHRINTQFEALKHAFRTEFPSDEELDTIIKTFSPLYQLDIDYNDRLSKLTGYYQIKWYLDHGIEYVNPAPVIDYKDSGLPFHFNTGIKSSTEEPEIISFGDETYFEDFVNKSILEDKVLDYTI